MESVFLDCYQNEDKIKLEDISFDVTKEDTFAFNSDNSMDIFQGGIDLDYGNIQPGLDTFNPDDFLNDIDKDISLNFFNRDTPSPSSSSISSNSNSNEILSCSSTNETKVELRSFPDSKFYFDNILLNSDNINTSTITPVQIFNNNNNNNNISLEPQQKSICPKTGKRLTRRTLILPLKDYKLLTENQKLKASDNQRVLLKTVSSKKMLPKLENAQQKDDKEHFFTKSLDEKALKKQQRMIKNRESASLSRQKKREYVSSLELKVTALENENKNLKNENITLRNELQNISMLCRCNSKNMTSITLSPNMKKNTIVLLAMIFMVSLNFGKFPFSLNSSPILENEIQTADFTGNRIGRNLLWINDSIIENGQLSSNNIIGNRSSYPICPILINQTENIRLATELRNWIGINGYTNLSLKQHDDIISSYNLQPIFIPTKTNIYTKDSEKLTSTLIKKRKFLKNDKKLRSYYRKNDIKQNHLQIFNPKLKMNNNYSKLFKEIHRRDDTFYVLSFNKDLMFLSAAANYTSRPKISFMLPADDVTTINGKITLMQIDCEVINTSIIRIREEIVPKHLRKQNNYNESNKNITSEFDIKQNLDIVELSAENYNKKDKLKGFYKPYFVDKK